MHPVSAVHCVQHDSGSALVEDWMLLPWLFWPGKSVQGPAGGGGPVTVPLVTAGSVVGASTELLR